MIIVKKPEQITKLLKGSRKNHQTIGFVPTMGALHEGHLSLIRTSRSQTDLTVCSIFVNPTQFNNAEDYQHYPITLESDIAKLVAEGCDVLFLPSIEGIYPAGFSARHYELGSLESILEGKYRPGHFQGVCQVVDRLLEIVQPDDLFMGQKDFQQCMVIKRLLQITGRTTQVRLHIQPTKREADGLAMSSRNLRLDSDQRQKATALFSALQYIKDHSGESSFEKIEHVASDQLTQDGFMVDYVQIANAMDLSIPHDNKVPLVALVAASIGNIRLIDNLLLN